MLSNRSGPISISFVSGGWWNRAEHLWFVSLQWEGITSTSQHMLYVVPTVALLWPQTLRDNRDSRIPSYQRQYTFVHIVSVDLVLPNHCTLPTGHGPPILRPDRLFCVWLEQAIISHSVVFFFFLIGTRIVELRSLLQVWDIHWIAHNDRRWRILIQMNLPRYDDPAAFHPPCSAALGEI